METSSPSHCRLIARLLQERDGQKTRVELSKARSLDVFNIAWGEDMGDDYEHITRNISPALNDVVVDLFFTDEVRRIVEPETGAILWEADGIPNVR